MIMLNSFPLIQCSNFLLDEEILGYQEPEWQDIITPIKVEKLEEMLVKSGYDSVKTQHLIEGFSIGYEGPDDRQDESNNLPFCIGDHLQLWNKVMKEVKEHRYAGPFVRPPTEQFIQSPIGLVPKAGGKMRLIFHLSYDFGSEPHQKSVNFHTPQSKCKVKYNNVDVAIRKCLQILSQAEIKQLFYSKTDCSHAFRILPIKVKHRKYLTMKAQHPKTMVWYYFIDKCLPFGSSISCVQFQAFSDVLKHIAEWKIQITLSLTIPPALTNYLDDFLFIAISRMLCNDMMWEFIELCEQIGCPIAPEKTEWGTSLIIFLGILLNGKFMILSIPLEKQIKAIHLIQTALSKRKVTIHFIQKLMGTLNFLNRAIVPGRAFTKGMYKRLTLKDKFVVPLKRHHHVNLNREFLQD